ncbi:MAG: hypothetical protein Q8930_09385 [Bacillota bacterium]|nr:hypothetical protein [Bacillota bacterium]
MGKYRRRILCGIFILLMAAGFAAGYASISIVNAGVISDSELKNIEARGKVCLSDSSPASLLWEPKNQKATLTKVTSWIRLAKLYRGSIPNPKSSEIVAFAAYIGPCTLCIYTSENRLIKIEPAYYLELNAGKWSGKVHYFTDVLVLEQDGRIKYIQSGELFNWLKNNEWEEEFKAYVE